MRTRARGLLACTTSVLVLLAGCSSGGSSDRSPEPSAPTSSGPTSSSPAPGDGEPSTPSAPSTPSPEPTPSDEPSPPAGSGAEPVAALKAAADAVPGTPYDMERESYQGTDVWEIKVAAKDGSEHEVLVTLGGSDVVRATQRTSPDDDVAKAQHASVSAVKALRTARQAQAGQLVELEIDSRGKRSSDVVWKVTLRPSDGTEHEVVVDAHDGSVLGSSQDDD